MNASRALGLIWLFKATPTLADEQGFVDIPHHAPHYVARNNALTGTKHWGLVENMHKEPGRTKGSGLWRLTEKGKEFVQGQLSVPRYAWIYNDCLIECGGDQYFIRDALGTKYDYAVEMAARYDVRNHSAGADDSSGEEQQQV